MPKRKSESKSKKAKSAASRPSPSDNDICQSLPALPDVVWVNILELASEFPARLVLKSVCRYFAFIIDTYFQSVGVIDVNDYVEYRPTISIDRQIECILKQGRSVRGMKARFRRMCPSCTAGEVHIRPMYLLRALMLLIERQPNEFQVFQIEEDNSWDLERCCYQRAYNGRQNEFKLLTKMVLERAELLEVLSVSLECNNKFCCELHRLTKLESLTLSGGASCVGCIAPLIKFEMCNASLDYLSLQNVSSNLRYLKLNHVDFYRRNPVCDLKISFPSLETLFINSFGSYVEATLEIDLSNCYSMRSIDFSVSSSRESKVTVTGFELWKNSNLHRFVTDNHFIGWSRTKCYQPKLLFSNMQSIYECNDFSNFEQLCIDVPVPVETYVNILSNVSMQSVNLTRLRLRCNQLTEMNSSGIYEIILDIVKNCVYLEALELPNISLAKDQLITVIVSCNKNLNILTIDKVDCNCALFFTDLLTNVKECAMKYRLPVLRVSTTFLDGGNYQPEVTILRDSYNVCVNWYRMYD